jgi:hypothetical protein
MYSDEGVDPTTNWTKYEMKIFWSLTSVHHLYKVSKSLKQPMWYDVQSSWQHIQRPGSIRGTTKFF